MFSKSWEPDLVSNIYFVLTCLSQNGYGHSKQRLYWEGRNHDLTSRSLFCFFGICSMRNKHRLGTSACRLQQPKSVNIPWGRNQEEIRIANMSPIPTNYRKPAPYPNQLSRKPSADPMGTSGSGQIKK